MRFFLLLLFVPLAFSSQITLEREWTIPDSMGKFVDFQGALVVNNSHQKIVSIESEQDLVQDDLGTIWVQFNDNITSEKIYAKAVVDVDYRTAILSDAPLPSAPVQATDLTSYDEEMAAKARQLSSNSSLQTIANLVNWIHSSMEYDDSYWDKIKSAKETFQERRGVCVQYAHLFISMASSLGFETRYVTGYVYAGDWQPHTWTEVYVPSYGWLPADPTYGQVGTFDNHIAIAYGRDQLDTYDALLSKDNETSFHVNDTLSIQFSEKQQKDNMNITFDDQSLLIRVAILNPTSEYVFGNYVFESNYENDSGVLLLKPNQTFNKYYGVNRSLFSDGLSVSASFNGETEKKNFIIEKPGACIPVFLLLALFMNKILV